MMRKADPGLSKAEQERQRWNRALLDTTWRSTRFNTQPNTLLMEAIQGRPPGTALDMHMGEGRNALYLARQGWQVTGVDVAEQALAFARHRATELGVPLSTIAQDSTTYDWGYHRWDLIVLCYADEEAHATQAAAALRPGGLMVVENFHSDLNLTRPAPDGKPLGFRTNELPRLYAAAGLRIVRYAEPLAPADFSRETHRLVQLVAQKP
ncbi:class I SAM-dependent methyltransferase [Hymenobacter metallilatus]|uniref:Methyltransferase domain-containing protein n=1 Tax=Hymenobacter metallilatus TaxID=2493666 RepID=A0A428JTV2_9BACT|nr:methyltransferase domain-containing protein [Hymenobacter metallilatus]RSK37451.1 methyltransferase domain-containing protein [Hymenobacter metallilatus]